MKKNDYKINLEEERKEIDLPDDENVQSRVALHSKNNKKSSRFSLVNVLLIIFTLIPISILIFFFVSLNMSKEPITPQAESDEIKFEKIGESKGDDEDIIEEQEKKELALAEEEKKKEEERKKAEAEEAKKQAEEEKRVKEEARQQAEIEAEEARKQEEAQQKELARKQAEEEKKQAEANQNQNQSNSGAKTHTVAPGETLYRISVNYYQTGDAVSKIRQANGLSSNSISVGQKLIIP